MEQWKDIEGYENLYQISNEGRVKSLKWGKERILKNVKNSWGYLLVGLCKNGERIHKQVHRLVAEAFLENPQNLLEVNHKDEDKTNNHVENLEWCSHLYNMSYGTRAQRSAEKLSKRVVQIDAVTREIVHKWDSVNECERNGYNCGDISKCCLGLRKTHKGYIWKYDEAL